MTDAKTLWANQKTEETVTLENIHDRAAKFERRLRIGNRTEYVGAAFTVAMFGWVAWVTPGWMMKLGCALVVAGLLFAMLYLARRGSARKLPDTPALGLVDFYRHELERRRDLLRGAAGWYILPILPGMVLMLAGRWYQSHVKWRTLAWDHEVIVLGGIIAVLIIGVIFLIQRLIALQLQRKIDELDRLK
jgi:hypothetical protein